VVPTWLVRAEPAPLTDEEIARLGERGFFVRDAFLGPEGALAVRSAALALHAQGRFHLAGLSRGGTHRTAPELRNDETTWLDPESPELAALFDAFTALRDALNRGAYLGLDRFDVQAAWYPGGGARYVRHRDAFPGQGNRRLTAICYLNPDWRPEHGGALRLYLEGGALDVEPRLDRLVVFLSERVEHEVLPAFAPRLAATAWFYGR
jgi:SM-20-related protein